MQGASALPRGTWGRRLWYNQKGMRRRPHNILRQFVWLMLALLLGAQSLAPVGASVQASMRCAGASPSAQPCARAVLPATGLTTPRACDALMACCRMDKAQSVIGRGCPMGAARTVRVDRGTGVTAPRCLVSVVLTPSSPVPPALHRFRWLLGVAPALAPPVASAPGALYAAPAAPLFRADAPAFSPHAPSPSHGLRAPPAA